MKNNNGKRKPGDGFTRIGLLLMVAALFLAGKNIRDISYARAASQAVLAELLPAVEDAGKGNAPGQSDEIGTGQETAASAYAQGGKTPAEQQTVIPDYVLDPDMKMPTEMIDGKEYIGILSIPDVNLVLPVMASWNYSNLGVSPCRYNGTAYKENFVICAHNFEPHFGNLKYLDIGAQVCFADMDGNIFRYEVAEIETLPPTAIDYMVSGGWDLTMFTCTVGGAARVTVRCLRQDKKL